MVKQQILMDGDGETTIFDVNIWKHPIERTTYKQMFQVPGSTVTLPETNNSPPRIDGWMMTFPFGGPLPIFSGGCY